MRRRLPPMTRTAWTYSRTRKVSVSPRMSRPGTSHDTKAMTKIRKLERGVEDHGQDDEEEERGDRQQRVHDAHHEGVDPPAEEARDGAVDAPNTVPRMAAGQPHHERVLPPEHEATEQVEPGVVGPERVLAVGRGVAGELTRASWALVWLVW